MFCTMMHRCSATLRFQKQGDDCKGLKRLVLVSHEGVQTKFVYDRL